MLRRALLITTTFTAVFILARWAVVGWSSAPEDRLTPALVETKLEPSKPAPLGLQSHGQATPSDGNRALPTPPADQRKVAALPAVPPVKGDRPQLISYRATYDLGLRDTQNGSGVADVSGQMTLDFSDVCDGYALNQRVQMRLDDGSGNRTQSDFRVANWEAHDGSKFRFSTRHLVNGEASEEYEGNATRDPAKGGEVVFTKPDAKSAPLPKEAIFPTFHTLELIAAAQSGKPVFATKLFDGTGPDSAYDVVAAIGKAADTPPAKLASGNDVLKGLASWPVQLSFYDPGKSEELPDYQVSFRLYPNGVSSDMVLDYGDFSINALLTKIEAVPAPSC